MGLLGQNITIAFFLGENSVEYCDGMRTAFLGVDQRCIKKSQELKC